MLSVYTALIIAAHRVGAVLYPDVQNLRTQEAEGLQDSTKGPQNPHPEMEM